MVGECTSSGACYRPLLLRTPTTSGEGLKHYALMHAVAEKEGIDTPRPHGEAPWGRDTKPEETGGEK